MPFYNYSCFECGHEDEYLISISKHDDHRKNKDLPSCENCNDGFMIPSAVNKGTSFKLMGTCWERDSYS